VKSDQDLIAQINGLFHPRSVTVSGAPRGMKTGTVFLMVLLEQGFSGESYPVNRRPIQDNGRKMVRLQMFRGEVNERGSIVV